MATADEILATMAEEAAATDQTAEVCTIDRCTRAVTIPEALRIVGVETDKDVTRRHFKVLCSYRGTNLSTFRIRIHFMNANKEKDIYYVKDAAQDGEYLSFSWVISRKATKYKGKLKFIACMVCDGGTDEEREWNSTLGEFTVLEGLEVELTDGEEEQARDAITQLLAVIDARESEAVETVSAEGAAQVAAVRATGAQQEASIAAKGAATLETIPDDYATLHNNVATLTEEIDKTTAPAIIPTVTDSIVTITDGAARPAAEVVSHIAPVQSGSGEASPSNVRPISGWDSVTAQRSGKNILPDGGDEKTGSFLLYATDKAFKGAEGQAVNVSFDLYSPDGSAVSIYAYQLSGLSIDNGYDFMPGVGAYARYSFSTSIVKYGQTLNAGNIIFYSPSGAENKVKNVQVEFGTTATPYEPYEGQAMTADLPETVYSGTLDWTAGILTEDYMSVTLNGTEEYWAEYGAIGGFSLLVPKMKKSSNGKAWCSHLPVTSDISTYGVVVGMDNQYLYFCQVKQAWGVSTLAELKTYLAANPVQIVLPLNTPVEHQLTPQQLTTLKGTNNVWSSTGETTLSYIADTKMYIDNKLAAIAAATL